MNKKRFLKWVTFIASIMCIAVSIAYATQVTVSADYSSATGGHVDGDTSGDNNKGTTQHPGATAGATSPGAATATTTGAATATNIGAGTTDATAQQTAIKPIDTRSNVNNQSVTDSEDTGTTTTNPQSPNGSDQTANINGHQINNSINNKVASKPQASVNGKSVTSSKIKKE
ncbi:hypothetical protein [Lentilactobacillus hilgardii]|uniref:hypothetical protein n=1 Tax=Lentilactobacillus hilgardii TaxID=1588 RepID=UPI0039E84089